MRASQAFLTALCQKGWKASFHFNTQEGTVPSQERFIYPQRQEFCLPAFKEPRFTCHDEPRRWAEADSQGTGREQAECRVASASQMFLFMSLVFLIKFFKIRRLGHIKGMTVAAFCILSCLCHWAPFFLHVDSWLIKLSLTHYLRGFSQGEGWYYWSCFVSGQTAQWCSFNKVT